MVVVFQPPFIHLELLDPHLVQDCVPCCPTIFFAACANARDDEWRGAALYESIDDTTFTAVDDLQVEAIMGRAEGVLANAAWVGEFDATNTVVVQVQHGTLSNGTAAEVRAGKNWCVIGSEVLGFQTATLGSYAGIYTLSTLLRGRRGTEGEQGGHVAAERFVLLQEDGSIKRRDYQSAEVGDTLYFRAQSPGAVVADALSGSIVVGHSIEDSITASTTQTQGQKPLTKRTSRVSTCANANDTVTLPECLSGRWCEVVNDGAQTLQIFPASGDQIDAAAVDASTTLAAAKRALFRGVSETRWVKTPGA